MNVKKDNVTWSFYSDATFPIGNIKSDEILLYPSKYQRDWSKFNINNMKKEFNLNEYLKDTSQKVVTRDERKVRIICTDANNEFPIIALVYCSDNKEDICTYHKNGHTLNTYESSNDLFFATIKREGWVNLFKDEELPFVNGDVYKSEKDAKEAAIGEPDFIASVKIEWEE